MLSIFAAPSRYVQGRNATKFLGQEMKKLGLEGPVLVIAGSHAEKQLASAWKESFSESGHVYQTAVFAGESSKKEIERLSQHARQIKAGCIVGAGGGKVLDTARAVADSLSCPIVNCPTLASSDAPCSALSVIYSDDGQFEEYRFYKRNPDLVLVDSLLIAKSPPRLLASGMGDALATWFEAKTVKDACKANQLGGKTTLSAEALAELCYKTLIQDGFCALQAVEKQAWTPALERIIEANTLLSGLGFESGGLALAHSVHNGLTVLPETHNYYHGEKVAFGLIVQLVLEGKPSELISEVMAFCESVGLPISLAELGLFSISKEALYKIAERATAPGETAHNEPFEISADLVADAIVAADTIGSLFKADSEIGEDPFCFSTN